MLSFDVYLLPVTLTDVGRPSSCNASQLPRFLVLCVSDVGTTVGIAVGVTVAVLIIIAINNIVVCLLCKKRFDM